MEPAVIAAIITGIIALFGLVVQSFISTSKNKVDKTNNFEKTLTNKLENFYTPICMYIDRNVDEETLVSDDMVVILNKFSHLISPDLLQDYRELIRFEKKQRSRKSLNQKIEIEEINEYKALRKKVIKLTNNDYLELQSLYNKNFQAEKNKLFVTKSSRLFSIFWTAGNSILILMTVFLVSLFIVTENKTDDLIQPTILILIVISAFFVVLNFTKYMSILSTKISNYKGRKQFKSKDFVPNTDTYKCKSCGEVTRKYQYSEFGTCPIKHNRRQAWKEFLVFPFCWERSK
ncbi:hypothetical protein [Cohnella mopanensis]|uniref:hypothetical protein n=1 Tax=Cohnella mopanensis TaxID=2911966 RepID=UPI001EF7A2B8|nr:hypothetical protein [Cohnella mopanensis]